jgi:hypothetical protein
VGFKSPPVLSPHKKGMGLDKSGVAPLGKRRAGTSTGQNSWSADWLVKAFGGAHALAILQVGRTTYAIERRAPGIVHLEATEYV